MRRASSGFVHTLTRYRSVIFASLIALFDFARRISFRHNHIMRTSLQASSTYLHSFMLVAHSSPQHPHTTYFMQTQAVALTVFGSGAGVGMRYFWPSGASSTSYKTYGSSAACSIYLLSVGDEWANDALARRGRVWVQVLLLQDNGRCARRSRRHDGHGRRAAAAHGDRTDSTTWTKTMP